jgi:chromosome segregation ATPase
MQRRRTANTAERVLPDIGPTGGVITPVRPEVAGFGGGRPGGASDQNERDVLARNLEEMAGTLEELDPRSSERMRSLGRAIGTDEGRQRWAEVDLRRAFNTERLAYVYALEQEGGYAHSTIAAADWLRNMMVLAPIFLTWFALALASRDYEEFLTLYPDEVRQPFLVLWERGFGGLSEWYAPSFSTVALIDAFLIGVIIVLTFYSHGRREAREEKVDQTAEHFQADLDNVLAEAAVVLAMGRGSRPALLARGVERLVDRFEQNSQELLTRLRVEHDRLGELASRREREFADFGVFASGMRAGAEETHRLLVELRQVSSGLQTALEDLTSEVSSSVDQGRTLLKAVQGLEQLTVANLQSDQTLTRQIATAAEALVEAADKGIAGADAAAQASRVATDAVRGIGAIAQDLAASQTRVERAVAEEAETNSRLAEAMRGSAGGMAASARALGEIEGGLTGLRDELGRLAGSTADQAQTLQSLLDEQASIATELTKVARDISAISARTAQRQDDVARTTGELVERLDRVLRGLGRTAGIEVEEPAAPGRLDPERLWPRRRS